MTPTEFWKSAGDGRELSDRLAGSRCPERDLQFTVRAAVENQELAFTPLVYWEGAIEVKGTRDGQADQRPRLSGVNRIRRAAAGIAAVMSRATCF